MSQRSRSRLLVVLTLTGVLSALAPSGGRSLAAAAARRPEGGRGVRPGTSAAAVADQSAQSPDARGATTTRLADGRWLVVGGESAGGALPTARVTDPRTGVTTPLAGLQVARTAHTATLLADGTVLIVGGRGTGGQMVATAEVYDPQSGTFLPVSIAGARARMDHTATVLTDGRLLIAGGSGADGALADAEIWDVPHAIASRAPGAMMQARARHEAELLADGRVRVSRGVGGDGAPLADEELFDPQTGAFTTAPRRDEDRSAPWLVASLPESGALDVPLDVRIALRFSQPLDPDSVTLASIVMSGPDGPIDVNLIPVEQGRLVFVSPRLALVPDTPYALTIDGAIDRRGVPVVATTVTLTTREGERPAGIRDQEAWTPGDKNWRSQRPESPWKSLKPLEGPPGVTALAGQVLRLDGLPLADVTIAMEGRTARTDRTGRFLLLLDGVTTGEHTFDIDARTANRPRHTYGFYEVRWKIAAAKTNVLPFTIWSPLIDTAHQVTIPSPTTQETVVTTPTMPGLELHLAAGTTILDDDHNVVRTVSLTPIPLDRTPFPLPEQATFTMFYTIQPGGSYLRTSGTSRGGWIVYPPAQHARVGQRVQFFNYDPDDRGWYVYGMGTVGTSAVVPDARTRIYGFAGASFNDNNTAPPATWNPPGDCCRTAGDPVDLATGIFTYDMTDVVIPDVMPLVLTRSYNSQDVAVRAFGRGMMDAYRVFLHTEEAFVQADLILPDGARIHYVRTSAPGLVWYQTEFEHTSSPTGFFKSTIKWNDADNGWNLKLKDGTVYVFGHEAALQAIRDRNGNETRFTWSTTNFFGAGIGNLVRVTSPNGRWLDLTYYAGSPRVYQVKDNIGRTWTYGYDANENLTTVTDPENHTTTYLYNPNNQMTGVRPRNLEGTTTNLVTNEYTTAADTPAPIGWVKKQTHADGGVYLFSYTVVNGKSTDTTVIEPRGTASAPQSSVRHVTLSSAGYTLTDTRALGDAGEQTTELDRPGNDNFIATETDSLRAKTVSVRDVFGNVTSVTRCKPDPNDGPCTEATSDALTTRYTYDPRFQQIATVTDPLNHTTTYGYDDAGNQTSIIDALQHQRTVGYNSQGQMTSATDPLQHTMRFDYLNGNLTAVTDPLTRITRRFTDAGGRVLSITDSLGRTTRYTYDRNGQVLSIIDALGGQTRFAYFPAGQLQTVTDANQHVTTYTYDVMGRLANRTDPLERQETFTYDLNGNPHIWLDRKGQVTTRTYDALDRLYQVQYEDATTITYSYDDRNRLTQIDDDASGSSQSIVRAYDDFDRLISQETPQGSIGYTYDAAGRRDTMTVTGQPQVVYTYDSVNRLTGVTRDTLTVLIGYDNADRRTAVTLPNGIAVEYAYDDADQPTALAYRHNGGPVGDISYIYDAGGQRVQVSGSWSRSGLPQPVANVAYDPANELTAWGAQTLSYDRNGNLATDGLTSYARNARGQLVGTGEGASATFSYDAFGRRSSKTVSGTSTNFLYDGVNVVQELAGSTPTANLLTELAVDKTFTRTDAGGTTTLLVDALGSALALADGFGTLQTQYTFEPFGKTSVSGAASVNALQFTERENDGTGLYYYRARYYDPQRGRFASEDAAGFAGINLYAYAENSPTNYNDPLGLAPSDNGLAGDIQHLRNIFPGSSWNASGNSLVIHMPCPRVIQVLSAQGYQNANSWGYNGPGSSYWNPVGHPGGFEWRTNGPGFHFRMQYPSSCSGDPNCTLDQFHIDKYNPIEPGQFWRHIQCDFLHLCDQ
jgi:RHS repeat-associated protein